MSVTCAAAQVMVPYVPQPSPPPAPPLVPWNKTKILPPEEFDHPYPGELRITRVESEDHMRALCKGVIFMTNRAVGCNVRFGDQVCIVFIGTDDLLATVGLDYETTLRHEIGHCNGWPGDHPGARYLENPKYHPFLQFPR